MNEQQAREVCAAKAWYGTQQLAARAALLVAWAYGNQQEPYQCPVCECWHLATKRTTPAQGEGRLSTEEG